MSRAAPSGLILAPAKPALLIIAADCDDPERVSWNGFLKSRVYAKLLTGLILRTLSDFYWANGRAPANRRMIAKLIK
jgi:hypothetical protein